jgi:hypothetical protein
MWEIRAVNGILGKGEIRDDGCKRMILKEIQEGFLIIGTW